MTRRDLIESLVAKARELYEGVHFGHDFQLDIYHDYRDTVAKIGDVSKDRIELVLRCFKSMPHGEWCETIPHSKEFFFLSLNNYIKKDSPKLKADWVGEEAVGFSYCTGEDDGYPTSDTIAFPIEVLAEDDDAIVWVALLRHASNLVQKTAFDLGERYTKANLVMERFIGLAELQQSMGIAPIGKKGDI